MTTSMLGSGCALAYFAELLERGEALSPRKSIRAYGHHQNRSFWAPYYADEEEASSEDLVALLRARALRAIGMPVAPVAMEALGFAPDPAQALLAFEGEGSGGSALFCMSLEGIQGAIFLPTGGVRVSALSESGKALGELTLDFCDASLSPLSYDAFAAPLAALVRQAGEPALGSPERALA